MGDRGEPDGRLSTETVDERRERLGAPRPIGSPAWRRVNLVLVAVLAFVVGVWFGVVPGSAAVGRYPVWSLYALADRIDAANRTQPTCGDVIERVHVDLVQGRVVAPHVGMTLTDDERAMVSGIEHEGAVASVFCSS